MVVIDGPLRGMPVPEQIGAAHRLPGQWPAGMNPTEARARFPSLWDSEEGASLGRLGRLLPRIGHVWLVSEVGHAKYRIGSVVVPGDDSLVHGTRGIYVDPFGVSVFVEMIAEVDVDRFVASKYIALRARFFSQRGRVAGRGDYGSDISTPPSEMEPDPREPPAAPRPVWSPAVGSASFNGEGAGPHAAGWIFAESVGIQTDEVYSDSAESFEAEDREVPPMPPLIFDHAHVPAGAVPQGPSFGLSGTDDPKAKALANSKPQRQLSAAAGVDG